MESVSCLQRRSDHSNDAVHLFVNELTSRIIAASGIPSDRFHLGKLVLQSLKDAPEFISQIDGGTGDSETCGSVLQRSVKCAIGLKKMGLQNGDVMGLLAPSHLDLVIPFYAALYLGIAISAIDRTLGGNELRNSFAITKPKIIFCQSEKAPDIQMAINELAIDCQIVTFDRSDNYCSFSYLLETNGDESHVENFKPTDFDPEETIVFLISTSGTTGNPKAVTVTHKHFSITSSYLWTRYTNFPTPIRMALLVSPLQWQTALIHFFISPVLRYVRLQTSSPLTMQHVYHLINTYKPTYAIMSPTWIISLTNLSERGQCDFSCFEDILLGGSAVSKELIDEMKIIMPKTEVCNAYGISEIACIGFQNDSTSPRSCGKPVGCFVYRLIDIDTQKDIFEANVPGELWIKGICFNFKGYYGNPEATKESFTADGWFKTGDMFYRDKQSNYYFVERIKLLLKYKSYQVSPVELETVIRKHPGVLDVAVSAVPEPECGDLPVACVVLRQGIVVTAQDIKDLIKESLSDSKQLRGGVIFMSEIPMTPNTKVDRRKLKELVQQLERE